MPILPENRHRYPGGSPQSQEWRAIVEQIRERSCDRCEGWRFGIFPECRAANRQPHPVTGSRVVLTVAHLNHWPEDCSDENLAHGCQRCHNRYDAPHRQRTREARKRRKMAHVQGSLFVLEPVEAMPRYWSTLPLQSQ